MKKSYEELLATFKKLGIKNPELYAKAEVDENLPTLAGYLFVRQAWRCGVIREDDPFWTGLAAQDPGTQPEEPEHPNEACGGFGAALNRIMNKGVDPQDLIEVIRDVQYEALFDFCKLLWDPGDIEPEAKDVGWGLFEVDQEGNPLRPMHGLYESVLGLDPTGREMRPLTAAQRRTQKR